MIKNSNTHRVAATIVLLLGTLLLSSCVTPSATGRFFSAVTLPSGEHTVIYIYNLPGGPAGGMKQTYNLTANDVQIGIMKAGGYLSHVTRPGDIKLSAQVAIPDWRPAIFARMFSRKTELSVKAVAGGAYYVRAIHYEIPSSQTFELRLMLVSEDVGVAEIQGVRSLE